MSVYYINGEFKQAADATVPVSDLALLRGYGIFDFLRTYGGKPFQLRAHLQRLLRSAALLDLHCPWDIEELAEIVMQTLAKNSFAESGIRLVVTGGDSPNGFMPAAASRLLVMVSRVQQMAARYYQQGSVVVTVETQRYLPEAKTINYIPGISAHRQALKINPEAIDAIYTAHGMVIEGTRSNIFMVKDGAWATPDRDLLLGVTRAEVIKLIEATWRLERRAISKEEFYSADEIVLTSSTKEVMPVVTVDDVTIGDGAPGEKSRQLMRAWRRMTDRYAGMDEIVEV